MANCFQHEIETMDQNYKNKLNLEHNLVKVAIGEG